MGRVAAYVPESCAKAQERMRSGVTRPRLPSGRGCGKVGA